MSTMNMPGFTADASLYSNTSSYRTAGGDYSGGHQQVDPQFWSELGDALKAVGHALWGGVRCTAATTKLGVTCAAVPETGDVGACTDAASEWAESCFD